MSEVFLYMYAGISLIKITDFRISAVSYYVIAFNAVYISEV